MGMGAPLTSASVPHRRPGVGKVLRNFFTRSASNQPRGGEYCLSMRKRFSVLVAAALRAPKTAFLIVCGLAALATSIVLFLGASEDVVQHNGASRLDPGRLDWFTDHRSQPLIAVAKLLNTAGSVGVVALVAVVAGAWLWKRGLPFVVTVAPLASVLLAETAAAALKVVVNRGRPPVGLHLVSEADPSFPSGHATAATAFGISLAIIVTVFVLVRTWSRVATLAAGLVVPVIVGLSRLELGVHWPTDVAAGLALGAATALSVSGLALWFATRPHHEGDEPTTAGWRLRARRLFTWRRQTGATLRAA